ncbi:MAG: acetylornithine deacetylase [Planctomycetota bacterium]
MNDRLPDTELLARLVGFDSTSANPNRPIADAVCDYLDRPGIRLRVCPAPDESKVNVLAFAGPEAGPDRGLTLCGHLDVVPAGEPEWSSDPFTVVERDGALYGRGTCDMKGFVALAVNTMAALEPDRLAAPLCLLLTCDEEIGCVGAQRLVERWPEDVTVPKSTVVGEPTSLRVVRLHKGHLTVRIEIAGRSAHSGSPHLGRNAIEAALPVLAALAALREELAAARVESSRFFPEVPFTALNVALIEGGTAINVIPDACIVQIGLRLLPGQSADEFVPRLERLVREAAGDAPARMELLNASPPMELPQDATICRELCAMIGQTDSFGVSYASDAGVLRRVGLESVLFGPGTIEVAHRPDEHVPLAELRRCREVLDELVARRCLS